MTPQSSSLWRNRGFLFLVCAYFISAFGDHLLEAAIIKEMGIEEGGEKTRISAQLMFFFFLPYVLLGPLAGATADRLPRRAIMIAADLARATIALLIPFYIAVLHDPADSGWLMMVPILGLGLFACFFNPARQALVPQVVADRHLTPANSVLNGLAPIASIISFVTGGWLASISLIHLGALRVRGTTVNFIVDGATFLLSALFITFITMQGRAPRVEHPRPVFHDIAHGFRYIASHRYVWQLMIFTAVFWTAAGAFSSIITTVVFDWYELDIFYWGPFKASLGAGMLIGAVFLAWVGDASRAHYNLTAGLTGTGVLMLLFSLTRNPWFGGALGLGIGVCGVWILISANTLLQRIVPNRARGRIFGIVDLVNMLGMVGATFCLGIVHIPNLDRLIGWILRGLAIVLLVIGLLLWRHHVRRKPHPLAVVMLVWFTEVLCKRWHGLRRVGACTVPPAGPCIVAANHASGADPCFIGISSPNRLFGYLIAQEYANVPLLGWLTRYLQCIEVRRDGNDIAATKQALRQLRDGRALGVFVQGRIQPPGETMAPREGVAVLALRAQVPVIPVHISGIKYHDGIAGTFFLRHRVRIRYGRAVDLSEFDDPRDRGQITAATQRIWQAILALGPEDGKVFI